MTANPRVLETVLKACRMQVTSHPPKFNCMVDSILSGVSAQAMEEEISVLSHSGRRSPSGLRLLVQLQRNDKGPCSILYLCVLNRYIKQYRLRMLTLMVLSQHTSRELVYFNQVLKFIFKYATLSFGLSLGGLSLRPFTKCMEELWTFWGTLLRINSYIDNSLLGLYRGALLQHTDELDMDSVSFRAMLMDRQRECVSLPLQQWPHGPAWSQLNLLGSMPSLVAMVQWDLIRMRMRIDGSVCHKLPHFCPIVVQASERAAFR